MLSTTLLATQRPEDGLLHASTDIVGSLRHTMLRLAGAPKAPEKIASLIRLETGTMWHTRLNGVLDRNWRGPVTHEIPVGAGLPEGWGGTADTLLSIDDGYYLLDYKTTKGEGIQYVLQDGAKPEHVAQVSAYYHALVNMGFNMVGCGVWYIPMNEDYKAEDGVIPTLQELKPLPKGPLFEDMAIRRLQVDAYLQSLSIVPPSGFGLSTASDVLYYLTDELAPVMEREQKLMKKGGQYNVVLFPHWSSMFCPYDDALCNCGDGGSTKIGHYVGGAYVPRKGYEDVLPTVRPRGY